MTTNLFYRFWTGDVIATSAAIELNVSFYLARRAKDGLKDETGLAATCHRQLNVDVAHLISATQMRDFFEYLKVVVVSELAHLFDMS